MIAAQALVWMLPSTAAAQLDKVSIAKIPMHAKTPAAVKVAWECAEPLHLAMAWLAHAIPAALQWAIAVMTLSMRVLIKQEAPVIALVIART